MSQTPTPPDEPSGSAARRIAGGTAIMMLAMLASRLLGVVRNAVISHQLGQNFEADVYFGAFQIPDLFFYLIAGGALSSAFIPVFTEKLTHGDEEKAWKVFSTVACVMFVVVSFAVVLGEIFAEPLVRLVNPGFSAHEGKIAATVPLTRIVLPAQICFFMGGLMMGTQNARGKFFIPSLGPIIYNLGIILGGVVLAPWLGMQGLCWGALFGAITGNFALQLWAVARGGMQFKVSFDWRDPDVMKVWKLMLPVILGVALPQVSIWINRAFSSTLGNGPMAALSNASLIMQVPLGVFAQAMAVAIFPTLSAQAAANQLSEMRRTASQGVRSLLFLTIPASVLMILLAAPIIRLLLQHGKFLPEDTALAVPALVYLCLGICAWSIQSVLTRSFYALQDTKTPVIIGTAVTVIFLPMNPLFMTTFGLGIRGLALATTIAAALHAVAMISVLRKRLGGFEGARLVTTLVRTSVASIPAGAVCWAITRWTETGLATAGAKLQALGAVVLAGGAGIGVFVLAARVMRSDELDMIVRMVRSRRGRPAPG